MTPTDLDTPTAPPPAAVPARTYTASELRRMPAAERDAILAEAAERAAHDYLNDPDLTAFEAFGPKDLYVDSSNTESR